MPLVHEDAEFDDVLRIVAARRGLPIGLGEKDYWVTHTLLAILSQGFALWFKGGTSLSKGFGVIERFSEDLDLKIEAGTVSALPAVTDWERQGVRVTEERRLYFERLVEHLNVPDAETSLAVESSDRSWRSAGIRVVYPGRVLQSRHFPNPALAVASAPTLVIAIGAEGSIQAIAPSLRHLN